MSEVSSKGVSEVRTELSLDTAQSAAEQQQTPQAAPQLSSEQTERENTLNIHPSIQAYLDRLIGSHKKRPSAPQAGYSDTPRARGALQHTQSAPPDEAAHEPSAPAQPTAIELLDMLYSRGFTLLPPTATSGNAACSPVAQGALAATAAVAPPPDAQLQQQSNQSTSKANFIPPGPLLPSPSPLRQEHRPLSSQPSTASCSSTASPHREYQGVRAGAARSRRTESYASKLSTALSPLQPAALRRRGVRVLSVDGGGVRGMAVIEIIRKLEFEVGMPLRDMFDLVVGVSTGSFLAGLLTAGQRTLPQAAELYEDMRVRMGSVPPIIQQLKRLTIGYSHNTEDARDFMRGAFGDGPMLQEAGSSGPKFAAVATNVDVDPAQPHLFRSYALSCEAQQRSLLRGSSGAKLWAAIRASTSAPTYYEPQVIEGVRYVDGGVTANNPSLLAVAEAHALWPGVPIELVVSIGTGEPVKRKTGPLGSVLDWMHVVFMTSLGSHMQHYLAHSLLPQNVYFRLDPADIGEVLMSESDKRKLSDMIQLTQLWCHTNHDTFATIADIVHPERTRRGQQAPAVWPPEGDFMQRVAQSQGAAPLTVPQAQDKVAQHLSTGGRHATAARADIVVGSDEASVGSSEAQRSAARPASPTTVGPADHKHTTYQMRPAALAVTAAAAMAGNVSSGASHAAGGTPAAASDLTAGGESAAGQPSAAPPALDAAGTSAAILQRSMAPFAPATTPSGQEEPAPSASGHSKTPLSDQSSPEEMSTTARPPAARDLGPLSVQMGLKQHLAQVQEGAWDPQGALVRGGRPLLHRQPAAAVASPSALAQEENAALRLTAAEVSAVGGGLGGAEGGAGWMPNPAGE